MRLATTVDYRVLVYDNMAFAGDFVPVLARHSNKNWRHWRDRRLKIQSWRIAAVSGKWPKKACRLLSQVSE